MRGQRQLHTIITIKVCFNFPENQFKICKSLKMVKNKFYEGSLESIRKNLYINN